MTNNKRHYSYYYLSTRLGPMIQDKTELCLCGTLSHIKVSFSEDSVNFRFTHTTPTIQYPRRYIPWPMLKINYTFGLTVLLSITRRPSTERAVSGERNFPSCMANGFQALCTTKPQGVAKMMYPESRAKELPGHWQNPTDGGNIASPL